MHKDLGQPKQANSESLEKYFFSYILENPKFIERVIPVYFKNKKIRYVYECVRNHYINLKEPKIPNNPKIVELVRFYDIDEKEVTNDVLEDLLKVDYGVLSNDGEDKFLIQSLYAWITSNNIRTSFEQSVDIIRSMDYVDYESTEEVAEQIRQLINEATLIDYDDDDLGLTFSNPEDHIQETEKNKIKTGWQSIDELLNGGWSRKTLNIVMGPSNSGKSLWLANMAVNCANNGHNVLYITLEMSDKEVMKRVGSMRLGIPINDYDIKSKDINFINNKINDLKNSSSNFSDSLFSSNSGDIFIKEYPSGSCSVADIENLIKNFELKKGIKLDVVVVDYLTIMQPDAKSRENLYQNGKYLSNGLRAIAQKRELCMITAMQVGKDNVGSNDISMNDMSESKSIYENSDTIFGIIRTDEMRENDKYILKLLKLRSGGFKWERTYFDLDSKYLVIKNDRKI